MVSHLTNEAYSGVAETSEGNCTKRVGVVGVALATPEVSAELGMRRKERWSLCCAHASENRVAKGVTAQGKLRPFPTRPNRATKSRG